MANWFTNLFRGVEKRCSDCGITLPWGFANESSSNASYLDFSKEAYKKNPVVYAALSQTAASFAGVPLVLAMNEEPLETIPANLAPLYGLIKRPNPNASDPEFRETACLQRYLGGSAFIELKGAGVESQGTFTRTKTAPRMYLLRPDRVKIEHRGRELTGYKYHDADGQTIPYTPEQVFTWRFTDPDDDFAGLSPLKACATSIDAYNEATAWGYSLIKNGAAPSAVMGVKVSGWDETKRDRVNADFRRSFAGAGKVGAPLLYDAELGELKILGLSPRDVDWAGGKGIAAREICAAIGFPSVLIGDPESKTYANYEQARAAFYTELVIPLLDSWLLELNTNLVPLYGVQGLSIQYDVTKIDALRENEDALYDRLAKATWLTTNEKREKCSLDAIDGGDELDKPAPPVMPDPNAKDALQPANDATDGIDAKRSIPGDEHSRPFHRASLYPTLEQRKRKIDKLAADRAEWIELYGKETVEHFEDLARELAPMLAAQLWTILTPADLLRKAKAQELFVKRFEPLEIGLRITFGEAALNELEKTGFKWDSSPTALDRLRDDLAERSRLIDETTATQIHEIIQQATTEGVGAPETSRRIQEALPQIGKTRANTIARTEVNRASEEAQHAGYKQAGAQYKEWVSARDSRVRNYDDGDAFDHTIEDGQVVGIDEPFIINGEPMMYPGDSSMGASPGNCINCRCTMAPLLEGDEPI